MNLRPERFRAVLHRHGEAFLWYRSTPNPANNPTVNAFDGSVDENIYALQSLDDGVKVLVTSANQESQSPDFGLVRKGDMFLTSMPDELRIGTMDKVVLPDREWETKERHVKGTDDSLSFTPVVRIVEVRDAASGVIPATNYSVDTTTGVITFSGSPIPGTGLT